MLLKLAPRREITTRDGSTVSGLEQGLTNSLLLKMSQDVGDIFSQVRLSLSLCSH